MLVMRLLSSDPSIYQAIPYREGQCIISVPVCGAVAIFRQGPAKMAFETLPQTCGSHVRLFVLGRPHAKPQFCRHWSSEIGMRLCPVLLQLYDRLTLLPNASRCRRT